MPCRHNETPTLGPWRAERWTRVRIWTYEGGPSEKWAWRSYNKPHNHIHSGERYAFEYLAPNLKAAHLDNVKHSARGECYILRMRNTETGDVILADIL